MRLRIKLDPRHVNGGVFLGLDGVVIKSHGGTDALGFAGAIEMGYEMAQHELLGKIRESLGMAHDLRMALPSAASARSVLIRHAGRPSRPTGPWRAARPLTFVRWTARVNTSQPTALRSVVRGVGGYLPTRCVTNAELADRARHLGRVDRAANRHHAALHRGRGRDDVACSPRKRPGRRLPMPTCRRSDVDLVIVATSTPDYTFPAVATQVQAALGIAHGVGFDLQAVCSGFVFAVRRPTNSFAPGSHRCALVIGAETFSRLLDWEDRTTCVLFGDGAGAVVLEADSWDGTGREPGILTSHCARTGAIGRSSTSTAGRRARGPSAI